MDPDAISRALAAHPRPWTVVRHHIMFSVFDAQGKYIWDGFCYEDGHVLVGAALLAYSPERDAQVKALVAALRMAALDAYQNEVIDTGMAALILDPDRGEYASREDWIAERMTLWRDAALAPLVPQE